ncbi:RdgB/HAM1 family non-canonical purine NTP pyrophosphatase [Marinihelvus fidelis]|uniref:dITP/XTP pyrophosphatase n=1 Tax=Marinihelvus fidelis TaxID=2613842 RepID=A0A5N0T9I6_9GAMM|nr:RdgB/HAM1 family non-canonical purine NTP pyrophosphatase [Marinihelvus fidelis]
MELVLASGNAGKLKELAAMLAPLGYHLRAQSDWDTPEAPEDAPTFIENALLKARNASRHTGRAAIADDSGLVVPALGGEPGIFSARYAGAHGDDAANNARLLENMNGLAGDDRAAYFFCAVVLTRSASDPAPVLATARWHGHILAAPRGKGGFGYDPLFRVGGRDETSAELDPAEKNRLSHRGQAVRALVAALDA